MNLVIFCHSLRSDWNHGNAHFVRGVASAAVRRGFDVTVYEPAESWSRQHLEADHGPGASDAYHAAYPGLDSTLYDPDTLDAAAAIRDANAVLVHEWTDPAVVAAVGEAHVQNPLNNPSRPPRVLLFHDTHHRCVTAPGDMQAFDLTHYDGVLAFGDVVRQWYESHHDRPAFTWHEAADPHVFHPMPSITPDRDLVWVGNWGDDERTAELHEFLIEPVRRLGLTATVHGVRYPDTARRALADAGIDYRGYLPNHQVPEAFARHRVTVHVPRRPYATALPGIPTIRPFEALACGIPLVSAPWHDAEELFRVGRDFIVVDSGDAMTDALRRVLGDPPLRQSLIASGRETVLARHTCDHRLDELLQHVAALQREAAACVVASSDGSPA